VGLGDEGALGDSARVTKASPSAWVTGAAAGSVFFASVVAIGLAASSSADLAVESGAVGFLSWDVD